MKYMNVKRKGMNRIKKKKNLNEYYMNAGSQCYISVRCFFFLLLLCAISTTFYASGVCVFSNDISMREKRNKLNCNQTENPQEN